MIKTLYIVHGMDTQEFDAFLEWKTELPTRHGYYWLHFKDPFPVVFGYIEKDEAGEFYASVEGEAYELAAFLHFLGPLPVPEEPSHIL
jgi:hypothetical protein